MTERLPTFDPNAQTVADDADLFESIAEDFSRRLRAGERPTVEQYATLHPRLAGMIRELLPTIAAMERAKSDSSAGGPICLKPIVRPERLGDFRIVREIGAGGMGVVYEAVQESLDRNVAVKILPPQMLADERRVRRFEREARLAAQLHHTNIVPVFGVGHNDGLHYYVMQLIDGEGLDRALVAKKGQPFAPTEAARIGRDVARALQAAHEQGILHRDVKPANVIVDRQRHVWITDFGLAQALEGDDGTTQQSVAGTLRYMPPERFHGVSDARGDVYSLGATLYELAGGRTPFTGESSVDLMRKITSDEAPRLRSLARSVPRDLETIVARAMNREPQLRYRTAGELADDLQRFLDGMPIRARRVSPIERSWRWCKRNRLTALALLLAVVSLTSLSIVSAVGYWRTSRLNADLEASVERERTARESAEATSTTALEALDRIFARFAPDNSLVASFAAMNSSVDGVDDGAARSVLPAVSPQIAAALEDLLPYYSKLADARGQDPAIRRQAAAAMHRIGLIHARLGRFAEAGDVWHRAAKLFDELIAATPPNSDERQALTVFSAELACDLGDLERLEDRREPAEAAYRDALARLDTIPKDAATFESRLEAARAHLALGSRDGRGPPPDGAPPEGGPRPEGGPPREGGPPPPGAPPPRGPPGATHFGPPPGPEGPGGPPLHRPETPESSAERLKHLSDADALLKQLRTERPTNAEARLLSARCLRQLAKENPPGRREWESSEFQQAVALLRGLRDEFPTVPDFGFELTEALVDFHVGDIRPEDFEAAGKQLREALAISDQLVRDHPQTTGYAVSNVHIHNRLAAVERFRGRRPEQERELRAAIEGQRRVAAQFPDVFTHVAWEVRMTESLARLLLDDGRRDEAVEALRKVDAALEPYLQLTPPPKGAAEARARLRRLIEEN